MPEDVSIAKVSLSNFFKLSAGTQESSEQIDVWQARQLTDCSDDNKNVDGFERSQKYVCEPDKTRVAKPIDVPPIKNPAVKANEKPKPKNGMTDYLTNYNDYKPCNPKKYNKVLGYVNKKVKGERGTAITKMVCAKSEEYGIDPEITARILDFETGGFVFTPDRMNPKNKQYKGVMQVDKTTIECLYADPKNATNKKLSQHQRAVAYDHRHYVADQERIDQLKKQYPTVDALYNAMKTDVEIGLEVGLMAYKGKLSRNKGNVKRALAGYCGSQYTLNKDSTAVATIWPLPKYNSNNT